MRRRCCRLWRWRCLSGRLGARLPCASAASAPLGAELLLLTFSLRRSDGEQTILPSNGYLVPLESVFSERTLWRTNLVPFRTIAEYFGVLRGGSVTLFLVNFAGNILVFVPLGLLPPLLWRRCRGAWGAALTALCSLFVELCQIFTGRSVDVDDLILNTLGGLLGWLLARLLLRRSRDAGV